VKAFDMDRESTPEGGWTEEDDAYFDEIVKKVDALADPEHPEDKAKGEDRSGESEGEEK
jgi:hypothetical protein